MKIITGDEFGLIKLILTQSKQVLGIYGSLDTSKSIVNIFSNNKIKSLNDSNKNSEQEEFEEKEENESEDIEDLILYVSSLHENYILNWDTKKIKSSYENENPDISFISSTIKFPSFNNSNNTIFINGTSDDKLNIVSFNEYNEYVNSSILWPWDNSNKYQKIKLRGISNSLYNKDSVYCLYQNTPLVLYNIQEEKVEYKAKNLPNDELSLRVPIHDTDIVEFKNNPRLNYVSTAYGEIRLYDKKASPRPSLNKKITKSKINKIDITDDNNYLFIGDNSGYCAMLDIRKNFSPCKTFKGNTGAIKTLFNIEQNNNLIVAGLDRYVKWFDYNTGDSDKIFVKNRVNSAILVGFEKNNKFEDEQSEIKDSEIFNEEEEGEEQENYGSNSEEESKEKNNNINSNESNEQKGSYNSNEDEEEYNEDDEDNEEKDEDNEVNDDEDNEEKDEDNEADDDEVDNEEEDDDFEEKNDKNSDEIEEEELEEEEENEEKSSSKEYKGEEDENEGKKSQEELDDDEENEDNLDKINREKDKEEELNNDDEEDEDDINDDVDDDSQINGEKDKEKEEEEEAEEKEEEEEEEEGEESDKYISNKRKREKYQEIITKNKKKKYFD
jgi:hypothetical protein